MRTNLFHQPLTPQHVPDASWGVKIIRRYLYKLWFIVEYKLFKLFSRVTKSLKRYYQHVGQVIIA